jgi:phosphoglycolate phosphatase-like HAD superfamily hydrolase
VTPRRGGETPLRAALFDLDGTLADTLAICYVSFRNAVSRSGGRGLGDAEIHALFGPSEDGMMQQVLPDGWEAALGVYFAEYERLLPTCAAIVPELVSALALLRERRIPTGLVTGKSRVTAMMSLRHFKVEEAFDAIETGSPQGVVKAEAIGRVLDRWNVTPARAIYVGDAAADMHAARDAGVMAVGAAWAYGTRESELTAAGADIVFTDAHEFRAWIDARTSRGV